MYNNTCIIIIVLHKYIAVGGFASFLYIHLIFLLPIIPTSYVTICSSRFLLIDRLSTIMYVEVNRNTT